jgi:hypothetical protein
MLLQAALAPEDVFDRVRQRGEKESGVSYYRCLVRQPLDERWPTWAGCLAGEEGWTDYTLVWGVLATDEDEAGRLVLEWQRRCYPLPATVEQYSSTRTLHGQAGCRLARVPRGQRSGGRRARTG